MLHEKHAGSLVTSAWFAVFLLLVLGLPAAIALSIMSFYGEASVYGFVSAVLLWTPFAALVAMIAASILYSWQKRLAVIIAAGIWATTAVAFVMTVTVFVLL